MSVIFLLIPLSVVVAAAFLGAFIWAVRSGQYEDTYTPSLRVLLRDAPEMPPRRGTATRAVDPVRQPTLQQTDPTPTQARSESHHSPRAIESKSTP